MSLRNLFAGARVAALAFFLLGAMSTPLPAQAPGDSPAGDAPAEEMAAPEANAPDEAASGEAETASPSVEELLNRIEERYDGPGFTARFTQASTIQAMDITDVAEGKVFVKRPGMMKWEYETPEPQIIVTDGELLWVYRPADNQVMTGSAPAYFGGGKGASFLSDFRMIRDQFDVSMADEAEPGHYRLKLIPKEDRLDITEVFLSVGKDDPVIDRIVTYNSYGDKTAIALGHYQFNQKIDDSVFRFQIPEGADIVQLAE
jgi:outer membrane lipoprotein carrier protein